MERLSNKDLLALLEFLRECYGVCDLDAFAQRVISRLPEIISSEITSYNEVNPRRKRIHIKFNPADAEPPPDRWKFFEGHMTEHPLIEHYRRTRDGQSFKISDFLSRNQFVRSGLYNDFYRYMNVEYQIAVTLPSPAPLIIGVALNRSRKDFSERDRILLNVLRPHLTQAYRNAEAVTQTQGQLALVQHTLEKLDQGVIVLTRDGKVTLANAQAIQWLTDYFGGRSLSGMRLPENLQWWLSHQEALLDTRDDLPLPQKPLVMEREAKRLVVRHLCDQAQCFLLFEEQQTAPSPQAFERLGLSRREAEVLLWVAQGKTNIEIGIILELSPRTVQKHLEHIFQKLGVENRTAAAAMAHEMAAGMGRK